MYFVLDSWLLASMLPRNPAIFLLSVHSQLRQLFHSCSSLHQLSQHTPGPQPHLMTSVNFAGKTNTFSKELLKIPPSGYKPLPRFPFSFPFLLPKRGAPPPAKAKSPTCALDLPQSIYDPFKGSKCRNNFPPLYLWKYYPPLYLWK